MGEARKPVMDEALKPLSIAIKFAASKLASQLEESAKRFQPEMERIEAGTEELPKKAHFGCAR